jgi:hypothetical protein
LTQPSKVRPNRRLGIQGAFVPTDSGDDDLTVSGVPGQPHDLID